MKKVGLIFPHQLFEHSTLITTCNVIYLVEEFLFFKQYHFHKQKIVFHRASMKFYAHELEKRKIDVIYIESLDELSDIRKLIPYLKTQHVDEFDYIDTTDYWLEQRIREACDANEINANKKRSPLFLNTSEQIAEYFAGTKKMFQTDFYKEQRRIRKILLDGKKPLGGKWTFDAENRLKYPKNKKPPQIIHPRPNAFYAEAVAYTERYFPDNYGKANPDCIFPTTHEESEAWLKLFFQTRFAEFGAYEDAIVTENQFLHHGVLTPMLNVGLLSPQYIIDEALLYASNHEIPLNSLEGFIRQILGWREYIRAVYELKGREERTKNYWGFTRKIPASFWHATTGIPPIDKTIEKVLETGYCHHIERLMVLGNFMLLCEFDPDDVYRWFMEMFVDAYDWVMVPNVYGMSQFADGGIMSTKPYISGSNYLMKMSDYKKGDWQKIWDGLFWRFMHTHRTFFLQNPRLGMLINSFDNMPAEKRSSHLQHAEAFIKSL